MAEHHDLDAVPQEPPDLPRDRLVQNRTERLTLGLNHDVREPVPHGGILPPLP